MLGPELGRGGMGVVHLAWDPLLRRLVALKQLLHADPILAMRFMREAQIQAKVEHPRICKVFEVDSEGGQPFIAMQYINGPTLGEARELLDLREKVHVMAEVAGAVHAAHRMGLVHRDLKPSNILLESQENGRWLPIILDFGLARDQSQADLTLSWGFVGTPAFMSPEQAQAEEALPASDIYSLGATFYALFSGHPPHEATTLAGLIHQQSTQTIRPLKAHAPGFPKDLDTILLTCLDLEPARRYGSAFELEEDLRRWLAGEPIRARAIGPLGRGWRKVKRHRLLSVSIATSLCAILLLVAWNAHAARRARMQVELVQRFGLQVREVEQLIRIERMLPAHDIRPAEAQVRQRMAEIQSEMTKLGAVSQGPGHYALGRGHLILGELPIARQELEEALRCGFNLPEVSYSLGSVLLGQYIAATNVAGGVTAPQAESLRQTLVVPALADFHRSLAHVQEDPAYGEAQVAYLEQDYPRCIQKCKEAFKAHPWMYEAKLLEARAWHGVAGYSLTNERGRLHPPKEAFKALEASGEALHAALDIAPSDERIYSEELARISMISVFQSDSGKPTEGIFRQTDQLQSKALLIRPDRLKLLSDWCYARVRQGFAMLRTGQDVRPLMQDTLARVHNLEPQMRAAGYGPVLGWVDAILADGRWRRGEDPMAPMKEMEQGIRPSDYELAQPLALKAEILVSRGQNPSPDLDRADRMLEATSERYGQDFYYHVVWGIVLLARADWQMDSGLDPLPVLDRGIAHLEQSTRINPRAVYPYFFLAHFRARRALFLMSRGQDPGSDLTQALAACQHGRQVTRSHYRLYLALAEVQCARAIRRSINGQDPTPRLEEARAALASGFRINPTDFHLHHQSALVELLAAQQALSTGHSPLGFIALAETTARRGLQIKADCPQLWLALAKAQQLRAEWAMSQGNSGEPWLEEGLKNLDRALAIDPILPEAVADRATLERLKTGKGVGIRDWARSCLERDPILPLDYRPS